MPACVEYTRVGSRMSEAIFYTGGALPIGHPQYVARSADHVARRAAQQGRLIYTIAPRQMGKTSLLKRIAADMERQHWMCCFIDLATLRNLERARWFRAVGEAIARACHLPAINSPLQDQHDFRTFLLSEVGLGRHGQPVKLLLLFDEVEGLLGLDFSDDFLMTIRDMYQQRDGYPGKFLAAFAGAVDPQSLVKDQAISPFNIAEEIALHDFSPAESAQLTTCLTQTGVTIDPAVHARIYHWAAGHPYLTQRLCETLESWVSGYALAAITAATVDDAVRQGLLSPRIRDKNIKHVLANIANPMPAGQRIWQRLQTGETVYSNEAGFFTLYLSGLVTEDADGRITIRNQIYREALGIADHKMQIADSRNEQQRRNLQASISDRQSVGANHYSPVHNRQSKTWSVLAGVNHYSDRHIPDLSVCADDVAATGALLVDDPGHQWLLTDHAVEHRPTRAEILGALTGAAQAAEPDDLLLFYFSGHGLVDGSESYLLPCDSHLAAARHTGLAISDVREIIEGSAARSKIIILDACHSGAALGKASSAMSAEFFQHVFAEAEGMAVLASCKQGQLSWEWHERQQSVFTYFLIEALMGKADREGKGFVTVADAGRYLIDRVKAWAAANGVVQTPTLQYSVAGDIVLRRVPQLVHTS